MSDGAISVAFIVGPFVIVGIIAAFCCFTKRNQTAAWPNWFCPKCGVGYVDRCPPNAIRWAGGDKLRVTCYRCGFYEEIPARDGNTGWRERLVREALNTPPPPPPNERGNPNTRVRL